MRVLVPQGSYARTSFGQSLESAQGALVLLNMTDVSLLAASFHSRSISIYSQSPFLAVNIHFWQLLVHSDPCIRESAASGRFLCHPLALKEEG